MSSSSRSPRPADRGRALVASVGLLLVAVLGGCAVGPEDHPVVVGADPATGPGAPTRRPDLRVVSVDVFLLRGDHLVRVTRPVQSALGIHAALIALTQQVSAAEAEQGLRTAIPASPSTPTGTVEGSVARVGMPAGFDRLPLHEQVGAMSQIVWTITTHTSAASVQLVVDGRDIPVPDGRGVLRDRPVGRTDYVAWAPLGASPVAG